MDENLPGRIKYWLKEAKHDCFFLVGPENGSTERIGAMKTLLMGDSEPFRAMLQDSGLAEKGDIRVTDVEPETFWNFLKCVYGGSKIVIPKLSFEDSAKLLYVADKYLVNELKTEVYEFLKGMFSFEFILVALSHPVCYLDVRLGKDIKNYLKFDFNKIINDDKFMELDKHSIVWIMQQKLFVSEIEVWSAVLQWAKHKKSSSDGKDLRLYLFDVLKYIRFLTMNCSEFWDIVVPSGILLEEEVNDICKSFVSDKPCSIEHLCKNKQNRYDKPQADECTVSSFWKTPKYAFIHCSVNTAQSHFPYGYHFSKRYDWAEHLWHVKVGRILNGEESTLGIFLGCKGKIRNWKCTVDVELSLINQSGKPDIIRDYSKTLSPTDNDWGWKSFCDWNKLLKPDNGFIKDNIISLLAKITIKEN